MRLSLASYLGLKQKLYGFPVIVTIMLFVIVAISGFYLDRIRQANELIRSFNGMAQQALLLQKTEKTYLQLFDTEIAERFREIAQGLNIVLKDMSEANEGQSSQLKYQDIGKISDAYSDSFESRVRTHTAHSELKKKMPQPLAESQDTVNSIIDEISFLQQMTALSDEHQSLLDAAQGAKVSIISLEKLQFEFLMTGNKNVAHDFVLINEELQEHLANMEAASIALQEESHLTRTSALRRLSKTFIEITQESQQKAIEEKNIEASLDEAGLKFIEQIKELIAENEEKIEGDVKSGVASIAVVLVLCLVVFLLLSVVIARSISLSVRRLTERVRDISEGEGDLTMRVENVATNDEIGQLANYLNIFIGKLQGIITKVQQVTNEVSTSGKKLETESSGNRQALSDQQVKVEGVTTSVNELASSAEEVARSTSEAAHFTEEADNQAGVSARGLQQTIALVNNLAEQVITSSKVITSLKQRSDKIGTVLEVIKAIAEQTNLLALNAAIEAARAGESGRGFAVVADEVRTLAQRTQSSTKEIEEIIHALQEGAAQANDCMESSNQLADSLVEETSKAGSVIESIAKSVQQIRDMNLQIASAAEQQSVVTQHISESIVEIDDATHVALSGAESSLTESTRLNHLGLELDEMVSKFRT